MTLKQRVRKSTALSFMLLILASMTGFASASEKNQDVCRALVLSGGGSMGAWEAGVIWGLANYGDPADFAYDVVSGVSAGSLNTASMAGFAPSDIVANAQFMSDRWANTLNSEVWRLWNPERTPSDIMSGCKNNGGCLDDAPLLDYLQSIADEFPDGFKRRVTMGASDFNTGEFLAFNQTNMDWSEIATVAKGSCSIPIMFPPQPYKNYTLMDGGAIWNVNLVSAIHQCMEIVDDESKIIIDVAICGKMKIQELNNTRSAIEMYKRGRDLRSIYHGSSDISWQQESFPDANYRYVFYMGETAAFMELLDLRNQTTWKFQEQGREQAQMMLELGEGAGFRALADWQANESELESAWGTFNNYLRSFLPTNYVYI